MNAQLYKTTLVIFTLYDTADVEIEDLAGDATSGEAICASNICQKTNRDDPAFAGCEEFFGLERER